MAIGTTAAILGAAAIGTAGSVIAGGMQSKAASKAAQAQTDAASKQVALQEKIYNQNRADAMPWLDAGRKALTSYMGELGLSDEARAGKFESGFKKTPGYDFAVEEGEKGVLNSLSALGMKNSGAALKALTRFRTGLADQTYGTYLDRLSGVSTGGQVQAGNNQTAGQNFANSAGQAISDMGAARASGYVGSANAWSNALSGATNNVSNALGWMAFQSHGPKARSQLRGAQSSMMPMRRRKG
jgi:hypothetical protein